MLAGATVLASSGAETNGVRFGVRGPLPKAGLRERAQLVKAAGYDGIELGAEWLKQSVDSIRKELDGTVAVSAIVGSIQLLDPDSTKRAEAVQLDRERLRMAKELGASCLIEVPVFGANRFPDTATEDRLLTEGLKQLTDDVQRAGVTLLLEPLTKKETHFMNLQSHGARIIQSLGAGASAFKLLSDFYHMQMEEHDIGRTLTEFGGYTGYVHLADGAKRTEPGSLPFDYRPGFRALKKHGYRGWLTVESGATDNPEAALRRALVYIRRQWAEA
jgi:sugar phosphate isomerase/epimerase